MGRAQRNPSPVERRANPSPVERRGDPSSVGRESDGYRRWLYPSYGDLQERPFYRLRTRFSSEFLPTVWCKAKEPPAEPATTRPRRTICPFIQRSTCGQDLSSIMSRTPSYVRQLKCTFA